MGDDKKKKSQDGVDQNKNNQEIGNKYSINNEDKYDTHTMEKNINFSEDDYGSEGIENKNEKNIDQYQKDNSKDVENGQDGPPESEQNYYDPQTQNNQNINSDNTYESTLNNQNNISKQNLNLNKTDETILNDENNASKQNLNANNTNETILNKQGSNYDQNINLDNTYESTLNGPNNASKQVIQGTQNNYNLNPENTNQNILNNSDITSKQINPQMRSDKNQLLDGNNNYDNNFKKVFGVDRSANTRESDARNLKARPENNNKTQLISKKSVADSNFEKVFGVSKKESGIRSLNIRQKNDNKTTPISKKSEPGAKVGKALAWGKSITTLTHYDKDKDAAANIISNTTAFMISNPYTNKLVDKIKDKLGKETLKKINGEAIQKIAEKKVQDLINSGVTKLSSENLESIIDEAASEAAKKLTGKLSKVKTAIGAVQKIGKGNFVEAGAELAQQALWIKLWPLIAAKPHIVAIVFVISILILMSIGVYVSISSSIEKKEIRNHMNELNEYAYNYQKPNNYAVDQKNNAEYISVSGTLHESVQIKHQNKIYKWLNDYFFNVDSTNHPKSLNSIKQINKDILLEFAKKIVVAKQEKYQINDDIFLNYFYDVALGNSLETDIEDKKQTVLDYIVNKLGDKEKIVINSEILEKHIDEKFKDYIEIMAECIKSNEITVESENGEDLDEASKTDQNESEKEKNADKLTDDQKEKIISEFKESVGNNETIDIDYYEKVYYNQEINFENENILGTQNDIYELIYLLCFIDKISANDLDNAYVLDIDQYKKLIENIYNETTRLSLDLVWNSSDAKENTLRFVVSDKTNNDTNASIELANIIKSTYKKKYDNLKKQIVSMDEEVENMSYTDDSIFDIWAIFNNELEYLSQENINTELLLGNNKLANSYKAMVSKTLEFITGMKECTDKSNVSNVWEANLNQLKEYLNQIAAGDKNKSQVRDISQNIFGHLRKLQAMAYSTGSDQYGSDDTKRVFNKYVGQDISKYVRYYSGNSLFRSLYIFKQKLEKSKNVKITSGMIRFNNSDDKDLQSLANAWNAFTTRLNIIFDLYSDQYIFGMCYDQFPNKISDYLSNSIKDIESGEKLGSEIINIVDEKIIVELNNLVKALDIGLELNNQKFDEKKNIMYKRIKQKDESDENDDKNFDADKMENTNGEKDIEIYENIDLNNLKIREDETRLRKININSDGNDEVYFLFNDIAQIKSIKSVFFMNNFGKWFSDSDFYNMFFIDEDYGFDNGNSKNSKSDRYLINSYYDDFKNWLLELSQIFDSMLTHDTKKVTDFGYELKLKEKENKSENNSYIGSDYHNFMEIENLIPGENIYSVCSGFVDVIDEDKNRLIIKHCDIENEKYNKKYNEEGYEDEGDDIEEIEDDKDQNDYIDKYNSFDENQDLYIIYEGLNIDSNLSVGQKIICSQSNIIVDGKVFYSKKSTVIGTAINNTLKVYAFLSSKNKNNEKEFVNPFLICNIHVPFNSGETTTSISSPFLFHVALPSPSTLDKREKDDNQYRYNKEENKSKSKSKSVPRKVEHRSLLKVFGEIIRIAGMIYAVWAIVKFSLGLHDYESVNYQAIWQFFAASILIFGGILLKYISGLR